MTVEKRPYRKKARAELEEQTRRRIIESTVELHATVGPARTSVSAVAERAGVRRSTVYRHFPDEAALFAACTAHWTALHPPPDLAGWAAIEDPRQRLAVALPQLYAYYSGTGRMMENLHRDEATMPGVRQMFHGFREYLAAARETLIDGLRVRGHAHLRVRAAIGHAIAFPTWRSLVREQGLDDLQAAALMCQFVAVASQSPNLAAALLPWTATVGHNWRGAEAGRDA
jgi:AcrR family transcriptional regulator